MAIGLVNGEKETLLNKNIVKIEEINHLILLIPKVEDRKLKRIRKKMLNLLQKVLDLNQIQVVHRDQNLKSIILKKIKRNKEDQKINILLKIIVKKTKKKTNKAKENRQKAIKNIMKAQIQDLFLDNLKFLKNKEMTKRNITFKRFHVQHTQIQINLQEKTRNSM